MRFVVSVIVCLVVGGLSAPARADAPLRIAVSGKCPDVAALRAALVPLLPGRALRFVPDGGDAADVSVVSRDDALQVRAGAVQARLAVGADCADRARAAAVFVALNAPPAVGESAAAPGDGAARTPVKPRATPLAPTREARSPATPARAETQPFRPSIALGGALEAPLDAAPLVPGVWLHGALALGRWELGAQLQWLAPSRLDVPVAGAAEAPSARMQPLQLAFDGARYWPLTAAVHTPELGLRGALGARLLQVDGVGVPEPSGGFRASPLLALSLLLRVPLAAAWAVSLAAGAQLAPRRFVVRVEPALAETTLPQAFAALQLTIEYAPALGAGSAGK